MVEEIRQLKEALSQEQHRVKDCLRKVQYYNYRAFY